MKNKFDFQPKLVSALKNYSKEKFMTDLMAGIIVGIVALPLAIAFGIASGAFLFGTSDIFPFFPIVRQNQESARHR